MHATRVLALAALIAVPAVARAADMPVTYTVQEKQLKAAIAGTNLTFQLYGDAACTSLAHTASVAVENVTLINKMKQFTPKNDTKLPNTVALATTLPGVTPASPLYLKVTGTGVIPVGGACQVQAAAGLGGSTQTGLAVKDANGAVVGIFHTTGFQNTIRSVGGRQAAVLAQTTGFFLGSIDLYFTSSNCTGQALLFPDTTSLVTVAYAVGTTLFAYPASGGNVSYNSQLHREQLITSQTECNTYFGGAPFLAPDGCCIPSSGTGLLGPVLTDDVSALVPPFHVE